MSALVKLVRGRVEAARYELQLTVALCETQERRLAAQRVEIDRLTAEIAEGEAFLAGKSIEIVGAIQDSR